MRTSVMQKGEPGVVGGWNSAARSQNWLCHSVPERVEASRYKSSGDSRRLLVESDYAEDAIAVAIRAGGEEELVVCTVGTAVMAELNAPEAVDFDGLAAGVAERT